MGWAAGFQSGSAVAQRALDAYEQARQRKLKEQVGQEAARYGVTEGAYGADLGQNIEQVRGLQMRAGQEALDRGASVEEVAQIENQFAPSIAELQRRQGLTAPDFSVGSRATNYGTRQEAQQAAAPMRTEGLAAVYRQAGDVEKADELEARAFEQQRGLAQEKRAQASFELQQASGKLTLEDQQRNADAAKRMADFNDWRSQTPDADFGAMTAKARELGMGVDEQFKIASNLTGIDEQEFKQSQQRIQKMVRNQGLDGLLKAHKDSKDLDPNSHFEVIRGKGGKLSLNRVNTETGDIIQPNVFSGSEAETTAYLNKAAVDPATIIDYTLNLEKTKAAIAASDRSGRPNPRAPNYREYTNAAGELVVVDMNTLPRGKDGQPVLPTGLKKAGSDRAPSAADLNARAKLYMESDPDLTPEQALSMAQNDLGGGLGSRTPPPPGQAPGESPWAPRTATAPTSAPAASATPRAAPTQGLTREQVGQAVAQQQGSVQAETRVRRAAIAEFEADPRVKQAYDAVRQLRRAGESARANNIEIQINAQRDRFINSKVGGQ